METKHTQGKWFIEDARSANQFGAIGIDISSNTLHKSIITVWSAPNEDPEAEANAKLVSAAPEMLYALIQICEYWNRDRNDKAMADALWHIIDISEEAIKKATE